MRRNCWTAALCLGLLLSGGHRLWADEPERQWAELKVKMEAEGWAEVAEGVFERRLGPTKVERLGYGRAGIAWHIDHYMDRLENLMEEYERHPSEDLANLIDKLSVTLANVKRGVRSMPEELSSATSAAQFGDSCSSICYSATANAYYLTTVQGVAAVADATFNSTCGFSGETFAEARAIATKGGTTTDIFQQDPHSGTSSTSHAVASVEGKSDLGIPCQSSANSWVASTQLGISYSTSDTNNLCPIPFNASIASGPNSVPFTTATCVTRNWDATATGGVSPYTYKWYVNNSEVATGTSYSRSVCYNHADFTLKVIGTDATGATDNDSRAIDISYTPPPPPSVGISGSTSESFATATCRNVSWTATASSGTSPYTYAWYVNNSQVATGSTYTRSVCYNHADFALKVVATDSNSLTGQDSRSIDVINNVTTPPTSVAITGSNYEAFIRPGACRSVTWSSTVSGGSTPYTYQWKKDGVVVGSGSSYTKSVCGSETPGFRLDLSANGVADPNGHFVTVELNSIDDCNPTCQ